MQDKLVIPALTIALLVSLWFALRIWYAGHRARMTPEERAAEDAAQDPEQFW